MKKKIKTNLNKDNETQFTIILARINVLLNKKMYQLIDY